MRTLTERDLRVRYKRRARCELGHHHAGHPHARLQRLLQAVASIDTLVSTLVLGVLFVYYGFAPHATSVYAPLLLMVQFAFTVGVTLAISAVLVYLRDLRQLVPLVLQLGLFATPVAYGMEEIPEGWRAAYSAANPSHR